MDIKNISWFYFSYFHCCQSSPGLRSYSSRHCHGLLTSLPSSSFVCWAFSTQQPHTDRLISLFCSNHPTASYERIKSKCSLTGYKALPGVRAPSWSHLLTSPPCSPFSLTLASKCFFRHAKHGPALSLPPLLYPCGGAGWGGSVQWVGLFFPLMCACLGPSLHSGCCSYVLSLEKPALTALYKIRASHPMLYSSVSLLALIIYLLIDFFGSTPSTKT